MKKIIIRDEIFNLFPGFYRGMIVIKDIKNQKSNKRIKKLLKKEIDRQVDIDEFSERRILVWDEAHNKFGSAPDKYLPSVKFLLKTMRSNKALPFINSVVALFNYTSLKYVLPCGGDDVDPIKGNLVLGISDGTEKFIPLGGKIEENPFPGEVIYYDDLSKNVMCRRWNWRNGDITKIRLDSKKIVINIDCLPPITPDIGDEAQDELAQLLRTYCEAEVETFYLNSNNREIDIL